MSITTNIKKKADKVKAIKYPCIMRSKYSDCLVLFTSKSVGVCIHREPEAISLDFGFLDNEYNMDAFVPFEGEITIEVKP